MRLEDLRDHLDEQAAHIDGTGDVPLDVVRRKAIRIRRTRIAVAVLGTAVVVTIAAGIVPALVGTEKSQPAGPPGVVVSTPPGTYRSPGRTPSAAPRRGSSGYVVDGIRIPGRIGGDMLQQATIGAAGQSTIQLTAWTAEPDVTVRYFCSAPGKPAAAIEILVDGKRAAHRQACPRQDPQTQIESGVATLLVGRQLSRDTWASHDGPVRIQLRLVDADGAPADDPAARLGAGIYVTSGAYRLVGFVRVPQRVEYDGRTFELNRLEHSPVAVSAGHELTTPAGRPFLVVFGSSGDNATSVDLDGIETATGRSAARGGRGWSLAPVAARPAGRAAVLATGPHTEGDYIIGIYVLPGS
jgi:hypothetical protein